MLPLHPTSNFKPITKSKFNVGKIAMKRSVGWFHREQFKLFLPPLIPAKQLAKATNIPLKSILQDGCFKSNKIYSYTYNNTRFEFVNKPDICFPYQYARKKFLKQFTKSTGIETQVFQIDSSPLNIDDYWEFQDNTTENIKNMSNNNETNIKQPVIAVMGHIDHGKTTLLDSIRLTNVASNEVGNITQSISCYHFNYSNDSNNNNNNNNSNSNGKEMTMIDTPGHEIFFTMRSNSSIVADCIILVIDVNEGLRKQSLEIIKKCNMLSVPIVIALNKIDCLLDSSNTNSNSDSNGNNTNSSSGLVDFSKLSEISRNFKLFGNYRSDSDSNEFEQKLGHVLSRIENELNITNDGSSSTIAPTMIDSVAISAKYGWNLNVLLESVNCLTDALNLKSPQTNVQTQCVVLEATMETQQHKGPGHGKNNGIYLTVIVHCGMLKQGMSLMGGHLAGYVKKLRLVNDVESNDEKLQANYNNGEGDEVVALPGMAARVYLKVFQDVVKNDKKSNFKVSLQSVPPVGDMMYEMDKEEAKLGLYM